jgi:predicted kinase
VYASHEAWLSNLRGNFQATRTLSEFPHPEQLPRLEAAHLFFVQRDPQVFTKRIEHGWIREGHGDLRAEHIAMLDPPAIFDCVEFNEAFRCNDLANELAFLAMDLDFHGANALASHLFDRYKKRTGDDPGEALWCFYKSYRACVRAKVAALTATARGRGSVEGVNCWNAAARLVQLANYYALHFYRPLLLVTFGTMGSGKSTVANALRESLGLRLIQSDAVRHRLLGRDREAGYGGGIYTQENENRVYDAMHTEAAQALQHGHSVVLDATYLRQTYRGAVRELARQYDADLLFVQCVCPRSVALGRLAQRQKTGQSLSDGRPELYDAQATQFEPPGELAEEQLLIVDTQSPVASVVGAVLPSLARIFPM